LGVLANVQSANDTPTVEDTVVKESVRAMVGLLIGEITSGQMAAHEIVHALEHQIAAVTFVFATVFLGGIHARFSLTSIQNPVFNPGS
jgi:hypothetical protein